MTDSATPAERSGLLTGNGRDPDAHKATIGLLVNDQPGVLVRISQVFSRRGYNIESLVVSPSHVANTSRMTITCSGPEDVLQQIILQLNKLVDVIHATDHSLDQAVTRELALFKVGCSVEERTEVLQIAEVFRGKAVDISEDTITIEATGTSDKLDSMESLLAKFDLKEMVRTGKVVMARGEKMT
ncbi:MAG: acetolactate synthase small subunit [Gemmatimonadetes bacterium]|jgi:acetolactate synthase I/III small subunit|nr:acetolactate synthase small subunit [Gemmatimonadota bacterium]